jgi:hypothetical protein
MMMVARTANSAAELQVPPEALNGGADLGSARR